MIKIMKEFLKYLVSVILVCVVLCVVTYIPEVLLVGGTLVLIWGVKIILFD